MDVRHLWPERARASDETGQLPMEVLCFYWLRFLGLANVVKADLCSLTAPIGFLSGHRDFLEMGGEPGSHAGYALGLPGLG